MNTGICKGLILGLAALLLSACESGPVLQEPTALDKKQYTETTPPSNTAPMMNAQVTLVAPKGYCIDPESLTQRFALIAQCSSLGVRARSSNAPPALLTVTLAKPAKPPVKAKDIVQASGMVAVESIDLDGIDIIRAARKTPKGTSRKTHLRSISTLGNFTLSVSLYSPANSKAQGKRGPLLIQQLVQASQKATQDKIATGNQQKIKN